MEKQPIHQDRFPLWKPDAEIAFSGQHLARVYFRGLMDAGIVRKEGDQSVVKALVARHFAINPNEVRVFEREGHWNMLVSNQASQAIEKMLVRK